MEMNPEAYEDLKMLAGLTDSFLDAVVDAWKQLMDSLSKSVELISDYFIKLSKKKSHDFLKEIKPNKLIMYIEKRNIYYCRNNCW